jgi:hypothetical protein
MIGLEKIPSSNSNFAFEYSISKNCSLTIPWQDIDIGQGNLSIFRIGPISYQPIQAISGAYRCFWSIELIIQNNLVLHIESLPFYFEHVGKTIMKGTLAHPLKIFQYFLFYL